ncbi:type I polyketide synthase [Corynebacterium sp.]|uniref:type I polyketide synthase n=1 Tax=Corynebacterium sp. TaxID=1720 RepID=UPI0026DAB08D|nr:type I polyketide synthase [Corynebacterium sp.]MDO4609789.1 SDR family NAD(P)-dependent oxidoreductase [Corynebacterium sp.]
MTRIAPDQQPAAVCAPTDIAVVGIACRFPGAEDASALWRLLIEEKEGVTRLDDRDIAGLPAEYRNDPGFVPVTGRLPHSGCFDAAALGMTEEEARRTDPQHLLALELAMDALDAAGFASEERWGPVGVFAGCPPSALLQDQLRDCYHPNGGSDPAGSLDIRTRNAPDYLPLRISHLLDLTGPSEAIGATCATGLAAVHAACRSLLAEECDAAIAAATSVRLPEDRGYLSVPDGPFSCDGRTRSFGAGASGPVFTQGGAAIVLRRLEDALADGDPVLAVIRGSAEGNDGAARAGFTAPSPEGQARVIAEAQEAAGIDPRDVGLIEAHGTGTRLGDPIEVRGLNAVFGPADEPWCALGSVKSAIGHADAASGLAGLVKAIGAIRSGWIPRTLHAEVPNPALELDGSAFTLADRPGTWPDGPRIAGVSSFGIGGANVHVVVGEAPGSAPAAPRDAVWIFAGGGSQWAGMADGMEQADDAYRRAVESLSQKIAALTGHDPRALLRGDALAGDPSDPAIGLPALFVAQVATARSLLARGARPAAVVGHSVGEYAAAVIAGALDEDGACRLVAARSTLMNRMPEGAMLATSMPAGRLRTMLAEHPDIDVAAVNAPTAHVLAGPPAALEALRKTIAGAGEQSRVIGVAAAAHSRMVDGILPDFRRAVAGLPAARPSLPMYSTATGGRIGEGEEIGADHWVRHLRGTVLFHEAMRAALAEHPGIVLQVGPGTGLARLASALPGASAALPTSSDRPASGTGGDGNEAGGARRNGPAVLACAVAGLLPDPFAGTRVRRREWNRVDCIAEHRIGADFPEGASAPAEPESGGAASSGAFGLIQVARWSTCGDSGASGVAVSEAPVTWVAGGGEPLESVTGILAERGYEIMRVGDDADLPATPPDLILLGAPETDADGGNGTADAAVTDGAAANAAVAAHLSLTARLLDGLRSTGAGADDVVRWVQLTAGAEGIAPGDAVDPVATATTGVPRVAAQETPGLMWRTIDVAPGASSSDSEIVADDIGEFLGGGTANRHRAVRAGLVLERRWFPSSSIGRETPFHGCCAIIGGTGAVGRRLARVLADRGHGVALVSRTEPVGDVADLVGGSDGAITWHRADSSDEDALVAALGEAVEHHGAIGAVVHAAVDVDVATFQEMLGGSPGESLTAKIAGSVCLDRALARLGSDAPGEGGRGGGRPQVLLMSSAAGTIGGFGLAGYVAASRFLDGMAMATEGWTAVDWDRLRRGDAEEAAAASEVTMRHAIDVDDAVAAMADLIGRRGTPAQLAASPEELNSRSDHLDVVRRGAAGDASGDGSEAGGDEAARTVARAWMDVLGRPVTSDADDFFASGGHSLLATKLLAGIRTRTGVELRLRDVLDNPTAGGLAALLRGTSAGHGADAHPGGADAGAGEPSAAAGARADAGDPRGDFDLTRVQHAYWVGRDPSYELGGVGCHFFLEYLAGDLDIGRYEAAWAETVRRHPMLRSVITDEGRQRVLPYEGFTLRVHDLRNSGDADDGLRAIRERLSTRVADPAAGPMLLPEVVRMPDGDHVLVSVDVIACDSASWMLVHDEIRHRYEDPSWKPEPLGITFADCVPALNGETPDAAAVREADRRWWLERVDGIPGAPDIGAVPTREPRFTRLTERIPACQWDAIRERAGAAGLTPTAAVMRAYADELAAWSGDHAFSVTATVFDRPAIHPDVDRVVGEFSTMMLVPCASSAPSFAERAADLQRHLMDGLDHRRFGGLEVLAEMSRRRGSQMNVPVVFTGMLGLDDAVGGHDHAWLGEPLGGLSQTPQVWLDHQAYDHRGDLVLQWDVSDALDVAEASRRFASYAARIRALAGDAGWLPADGDPADSGTTGHRHAVVGAWREILGGSVPDPLPDDATFLSLGGDSLLAVRMANAIRGRTGIRLPLRDVRADVTVAELVDRLDAESPDPGTAAEPAAAIPADVAGQAAGADGGENRPFPLTPLQQAYFVGQQGAFDGSYSTAHVTTDVALHGIRETDPVTVQHILEDACSTVSRRHPMLRVRVSTDGTQRTLPADAPDTGIEARVHDLRDAADPGAELDRIREALTIEGPDPASGATALVAVTLLPGGEARFHVSSSLLAVDGWSASLLDRDLLDAIAGRPLPGAPRMTFPRYLELLGEPEAEEARAADLRWWRERIPALPSAPALPGSPVAADRMEMLEDRLGPVELAGLREQASAHGVTPSQALLTAYAVALSAECRQDAMLLTTLQHDRRMFDDDVARIIGPFSRTALAAPDLSGGGTFAELARRVAADQAELDAHPDVSAVEITRMMPRRGSRGAVAPVVFQSTLGMDASLGGDLPVDAGPLGSLDVADYVQGLRTPQVELELRCFDLRGELVLSVAAMPRGDDLALRILGCVAGIARRLAAGSGWEALHEPVGDPDSRGIPAWGCGPGEDQGGADAASGPGADDAAALAHDAWGQVATCWREILGTASDPRPGDDFFDAGGDSLLAIRLIGAIRARGIDGDLRTFLDEPTPRTLLPLTGCAAEDAPGPGAGPDGTGRANSWPTPQAISDCLQTLRRGTGRPLFLIHPSGGDVLCYMGIARLGARGRPVLGLADPGLAGHPVPAGIPALVDLYAAAIAAEQPEGPVTLGGWSMGGTVGHEVARRLRAMGRDVDLLIMLDSNSPARIRRLTGKEAEIHSCTRLRHLRSIAAFVGLETPDGDADVLMRRLVDAGAFRDADAAEERLGVFARHLDGLGDHEASELDESVPVLLMRAGRTSPCNSGEGMGVDDADEPLLGWRGLIRGPVSEHEIDAHHYSLLRDPALPEVVRLIDDALRRWTGDDAS